MDNYDKPSITDITANQVAAYLKLHPDFFLKRDDLLTEIEVAHPAGGAVSLLERQVSVLRERSVDLRHRLNSLLDNARTNDHLFEQTKKLVCNCSKRSRSIISSIRLHGGLEQDFQIDFASVVLIGNPAQHRGLRARLVTYADARVHIDSILKSSKAVCGVLRPEEVKFLFSGAQPPDRLRRSDSAAPRPTFGRARHRQHRSTLFPF